MSRMESSKQLIPKFRVFSTKKKREEETKIIIRRRVLQHSSYHTVSANKNNIKWGKD